MRWADLSHHDRRVLAEGAQRMLGDPAFQQGILEARSEAVERLVRTKHTDCNQILVEQAHIRALDELESKLRNFTLTLANDRKS